MARFRMISPQCFTARPWCGSSKGWRRFDLEENSPGDHLDQQNGGFELTDAGSLVLALKS